MLKAFLLFFVIETIHCSCPSGFELIRDGECRGLYEHISSYYDEYYNDVVNKCMEIKGLPIIIHDEEQESYWKDLIGKTIGQTVIGLTCNTNTRRWQWTDGTALDYKPHNYESELDQDCKTGCMWTLNKDGRWNIYCGHYSWTSDVFCTYQLQLPVPAGDGCDSFADDSDDGVCYQVGTGVENFKEAQQLCSSFGANLASIHSEQENSFIRRLAVSKGALNGVYLGGTLVGKSKDFGWIDGTDWDYSNYYHGFPMDGAGDCLAMDTSTTTGQWMNLNCSTNLAVACIRNQNQAPDYCDGPWKEGQLIFSPGFPFDASTPCDYFFTVESGKGISVDVVFLEANSYSDRLIVTDNFLGGKVIANLTGEISDQTITTTSNAMRVSWEPNTGKNVRGMMITYRAV